MTPSEQIVSRINESLNALGIDGSAKIADLAEEYRQHVTGVNRRLDRCVSLLRQGLRSEALHLAEVVTPVLAEAAVLDFPGRDQFEQVCAEHGAGELPAINREAATEIDEAYPQEQNASGLLRVHRRLAIGRGPLKRRMKTLRRLYEMDRGNPIWTDSLTEFERARQAQISHRVEQTSDPDELIQLKEEIDELWLTAPSSALVRKVGDRCVAVQIEHAKTRMQQLAPKIEAAHITEDQDELNTLAHQWQDCVQTVGAEADTLTPTTIHDALQWLEERNEQRDAEQQFQYLTESLESNLDEKKPFDVLERLWSRLVAHNLPIPPLLRNRYETRVRERRLQLSRRYRLAIFCVAAVLLVVGATVAWITRSITTQQKTDRWREPIASAIEQSQWTEARALLDELAGKEPTVWTSPEIQALNQDLRAKMETDQERQKRFEAALKQVLVAGIELPDREALERATSLAATEAEKRRVDELKDQIRARKLVAKADLDEVFAQALEDAKGRFALLRARADAGDLEVRDQLFELQHGLSPLIQAQDVSQALKTSLHALKASLNSVILSLAEQAEQQRERMTALERIRGSYANANELITLLKKFSQRYPDHPVAASFPKLADLGPQWQAVESWRQIAQRIRLFAHGNANEANNDLQLLQNYLTANERSPYKHTIEDYTAYLKRAAWALNDANSPTQPDSPLMTLLTQRIISQLKVLTTTGDDPKHFYVRDRDDLKPWDNKIDASLTYVANNGQALGHQRRATKIVKISSFADLTPAETPQSRFAAEARTHLTSRSKMKRWQELHIELLDLLARVEGIDAVLEVILAREFAQGSLALDWDALLEMSQWVDRLNRVRTDVNWMDPEDEFVAPIRAQARVVLDARPDLSTVLGRYESFQGRIKKELSPRLPVALLWPAADGAPGLTGALAPQILAGALEVLATDAANRGTFVQIAVINQGKIVWSDRETPYVKANIVYWVP